MSHTFNEKTILKINATSSNVRESLKQKRMGAHHDVHQIEGVVGVLDQPHGGHRLVFPNFGGDHEADGAEELELGSSDAADAQESVEVVHGQAEDLRIAIPVFADLQHPVADFLPHVRLDLALHGRKVVPGGRNILGLFPEQGLENPIVPENDRIVVSSSRERSRCCRRRDQDGHGGFPERPNNDILRKKVGIQKSNNFFVFAF